MMYDTKISKTKSPITKYDNVVIGIKEKGDRTITKLAWVEGKENTVAETLTAITEPCWLYVWSEDDASNKIAKEAGFNWVGTKVTTFAELYSIYFREARNANALFPREHPKRMDVEDCCLEKTSIDAVGIHNLVKAVESLDNEYTDHYSNYNTKNSWGALSLRGYTNDPAFITKPVEMSKKWQEEKVQKN